MADILLTGFSESVAGAFGTTTGDTSFVSDLQRAVNRAINDINRLADLQTQLSEVSSLDGTVALDSKHESTLFDATCYQLVKMGRSYRDMTGGTKAMGVVEWRQLSERAIADLWMDLVNQTDPTTTDVIGLGYPQY